MPPIPAWLEVLPRIAEWEDIDRVRSAGQNTILFLFKRDLYKIAQSLCQVTFSSSKLSKKFLIIPHS